MNDGGSGASKVLSYHQKQISIESQEVVRSMSTLEQYSLDKRKDDDLILPKIKEFSDKKSAKKQARHRFHGPPSSSIGRNPYQNIQTTGMSYFDAKPGVKSVINSQKHKEHLSNRRKNPISTST